jgi:hypothetical protein
MRRRKTERFACNPNQFAAAVVASAEERVSVVFRSIDVQVVWRECGEGAAATEAGGERRFTIRLHYDALPKTAGPMSPDAADQACIPAEEERVGWLTHTIYWPVQAVATANGSDAGAPLGP